MKIIFLILTTVSSMAFANVKPAGTFIATNCSFSSNENQVCFGGRVSTDGKYLSIKAGAAKATVYFIAIETPTNGGINPTSGASDLSLRSVPSSPDEEVIQAFATVHTQSGIVTSVAIALANGTRFVVGNFKTVMHTM